MSSISRDDWFRNSGGFGAKHDLSDLNAGIEAGYLNDQDEWGMTALMMAVSSRWLAGVKRLLAAAADTSLRYHRTGETALHFALNSFEPEIVAALTKAGANPDAANHAGMTPRKKRPDAFAGVPEQPVELPPLIIQNAEHLADHYHPRFKIPTRKEREDLQPGQAVELCVLGPKDPIKQTRVKVRIDRRNGEGPSAQYVGSVETPLEQTYLPVGTRELQFGPEHVATVIVSGPAPKKTKRQK